MAQQEIYRQVEQLDWVVESIAVGQELPDGDTRIVRLTRQQHDARMPKINSRKWATLFQHRYLRS